MKIPETIRIDGIDYKISWGKGVNDGQNMLLGTASAYNSEIQLKRGQSHQYACVTLWHEILHCIEEHKQVKLGKNKEDIIDAFAFGVYQVLQDNGKKLFDIKEEL